MFSKLIYVLVLSVLTLNLYSQTQLVCGKIPTTQERTYYKSVTDFLRNRASTRTNTTTLLNGTIPIY